MSFLDDILKRKCLESARRYDAPTMWRVKNWREYSLAESRGWLSECTAHMRARKRELATYQEVKDYCVANGIKTLEKYWAMFKEKLLPTNFPRSLNDKYGDEYRNGDLFVQKKHELAPLSEIIKICGERGIDTKEEYKKRVRAGELPSNFPLSLIHFYGDEYRGSKLFKKYVTEATLEQVKEWCTENNIRTTDQYLKASNKPNSFPKHVVCWGPYKRGKFLETSMGGRTRTTKEAGFAPLSEIRTWCEGSKVRTAIQYRKLWDEGKLPSTFPRSLKRYGEDGKWFFMKNVATFEEFTELCMERKIDTLMEYEEAQRSGNLPKGFPVSSHKKATVLQGRAGLHCKDEGKGNRRGVHHNLLRSYQAGVGRGNS